MAPGPITPLEKTIVATVLAVKKARAKGYAAGLEAALKIVNQWRGSGLVIEEIAKAIRALKEKPKP